MISKYSSPGARLFDVFLQSLPEEMVSDDLLSNWILTQLACRPTDILRCVVFRSEIEFEIDVDDSSPSFVDSLFGLVTCANDTVASALIAAAKNQGWFAAKRSLLTTSSLYQSVHAPIQSKFSNLAANLVWDDFVLDIDRGAYRSSDLGWSLACFLRRYETVGTVSDFLTHFPRDKLSKALCHSPFIPHGVCVAISTLFLFLLRIHEEGVILALTQDPDMLLFLFNGLPSDASVTCLYIIASYCLKQRAPNVYPEGHSFTPFVFQLAETGCKWLTFVRKDIILDCAAIVYDLLLFCSDFFGISQRLQLLLYLWNTTTPFSSSNDSLKNFSSSVLIFPFLEEKSPNQLTCMTRSLSLILMSLTTIQMANRSGVVYEEVCPSNPKIDESVMKTSRATLVFELDAIGDDLSKIDRDHFTCILKLIALLFEMSKVKYVSKTYLSAKRLLDHVSAGQNRIHTALVQKIEGIFLENPDPLPSSSSSSSHHTVKSSSLIAFTSGPASSSSNDDTLQRHMCSMCSKYTEEKCPICLVVYFCSTKCRNAGRKHKCMTGNI